MNELVVIDKNELKSLMAEVLDDFLAGFSAIGLKAQKGESTELMDTEACAKMLKRSKDWLYRMTSTKQIPFFKVGGKVYFSRADVEKWVMAQRVMTKDEIEAKAQSYVSCRRK